MKRILFVDDEPDILEAIRAILRRRRRTWEQHFAAGSAEALSLLDTGPFDVVVSDVRMPGMDGLSFLQKVRATQPTAIRIVLSGQWDRESALSALPIAHRFLKKPCDGDALQNAIERSCQLQDLLSDPRLAGEVGRLGHLPPAPGVYFELTQALSDPKVPIAQITEIVSKDPAIAAKVLQLVNSAFFGLGRKTTSIRDAVICLGLDTIRNITLGAHVFAAAERSPLPAGFSVATLQHHSLAVAKTARRVLASLDSQAADAAFTAGLVHDIGSLVLAAGSPARWSAVRAQAAKTGQPEILAEREILGVTHADIGAYLLGAWGLPHNIVEAVANHHAPGSMIARHFDVSGAVHVADALLEPSVGGRGGAGDGLALDYLERVGVTDKLPGWRALAATEALDA